MQSIYRSDRELRIEAGCPSWCIECHEIDEPPAPHAAWPDPVPAIGSDVLDLLVTAEVESDGHGWIVITVGQNADVHLTRTRARRLALAILAADALLDDISPVQRLDAPVGAS